MLDYFHPDRLRRGLETPTLFGRELNRLYHTRLKRRPYNLGGVDLFAEDWDTLAIADACRYDTFAAHHNLSGHLESRKSRASNTSEWLGANFTGNHRDTIYVTANPQYERNHESLDIQFYNVINVWAREGWDPEFQTVRPETITAAALDAGERYPHKRLLIHYIQPHYPFIGQTGREHFDGDSMRFWDRVVTGDVDKSDDLLRQAHDENFKLMLPALSDLLDGRPGRTVVTADHGQMLGERSFPIPIREYGHPDQTYIDKLITIPWLVHKNGKRPKITASEAVTTDHQDNDLDDRLKALGYAD